MGHAALEPTIGLTGHVPMNKKLRGDLVPVRTEIGRGRPKDDEWAGSEQPVARRHARAPAKARFADRRRCHRVGHDAFARAAEDDVRRRELEVERDRSEDDAGTEDAEREQRETRQPGEDQLAPIAAQNRHITRAYPHVRVCVRSRSARVRARQEKVPLPGPLRPAPGAVARSATWRPAAFAGADARKRSHRDAVATRANLHP